MASDVRYTKVTCLAADRRACTGPCRRNDQSKPAEGPAPTRPLGGGSRSRRASDGPLVGAADRTGTLREKLPICTAAAAALRRRQPIVVHMNAAAGSLDPLPETAWLRSPATAATGRTAGSPRATGLTSWPTPSEPWSRVPTPTPPGGGTASRRGRRPSPSSCASCSRCATVSERLDVSLLRLS